MAICLLTNQAVAQCSCPDITESGNVTITVQTVSELQNALDQANTNNGNMTILLEPGEYALNSNLRFISDNMSNLTIMGSTGVKEDVFIKGLGWNNNAVTHIFNVAADYFTLAHMTIGEVYFHPVQVHSNPSDADDFLMQNVRIIDAKEQLFKVSAGGNLFADRGQILCCEFEFTSGVAYQNYTGGIDAHRAKDWIVRNNVFKHIRSPDDVLAEHAIHMWRESEGTIVDANQIIDCDRGIGFGLGPNVDSGHPGGLIVNNFVHTSRDVGIGLESAPNALVYNNTVVTDNYNRSIEYRFSTTTNVEIVNNLVTDQISDRSSGSTGTELTNHQVTNFAIFTDAANYDYHIDGNPTDVIDAGTDMNYITTDYDCDSRTLGAGIDIGADEVDLTSNTDVLLLDQCIELFPNPTQGVFSIHGFLGDYTIEIIDGNGVLFQSFTQTSGQIDIDLSNLPNGLYFVRIKHKLSVQVYLQTIIKS